jgi:hypothetical protein
MWLCNSYYLQKTGQIVPALMGIVIVPLLPGYDQEQARPIGLKAQGAVFKSAGDFHPLAVFIQVAKREVSQAFPRQ